MFTAPNQFAAYQQAAVDSFVRIANIQLESTKRLADLNFATARELVEEGLKNSKSIGNIRDIKDVVSSAKPVANKTLAYSRSVYEILATANNELKEIGEAHVAEANKQVATALDNAAKSAPAGSEPFVAFVRSTVSASTSALDQVSRIGKQVASAVESNIATAFAAAEKPVA